jgi:hypothetical protein
MYQAFAATGNGGNSIPPTLGQRAVETAYLSAMAPNPWEGTRYNIINDLGNDSFMKNFAPQNNEILAAFWAPVFPPGQVATSKAQIETDLNQFFNLSNSGQVGNFGGTGAAALGNLGTTFKNQFTHYVSTTLANGSGEDGEGLNIVRITDPFHELQNGAPKLISGNANVFMSTPADFKTSWDTVNDSDFRSEGRVGYSVKFISFNSLTSNKSLTDGNNTWNNSPSLDDEAGLDVPFIKH